MNKQALILIALFVFIFIRSAIIEPNSLEVVKYEIEDSQLQGIRVAFLSDFHLKKRDYKRLDKIVRLTNTQDPDLVLLGGDFAVGHNIKSTMNPQIMAQKLSLLNSPTYAVLGEQDWWTDPNLIKNSLKDNGIKTLENSNVRIVLKRRLLDIIGITDYKTKNYDIASAVRKTDKPRLVMTHNPDIYYNIIDDVNLIFAGHTHGGQFILPYSKPMFVASENGNDLVSGLIKKTKNKMIVSKGLGATGIPLRLNCKPEITIVDFVKVGSTKSIRRR